MQDTEDTREESLEKVVFCNIIHVQSTPLAGQEKEGGMGFATLSPLSILVTMK